MNYDFCNARRSLRNFFHRIAGRTFKMGWKKVLTTVLFVGVVGTVILMYLCGSNFCTVSPVIQTTDVHSAVPLSEIDAYKQGMLPANIFSNRDIEHLYNLKLEKVDVIVFLHVQKTGGTTLGRHLVRNLELETPCQCFKKKKRCDCYTDKKTIWLFSRYSTGWICGLHADWTELTACVEDAMNKKEEKKRHRRYLYISILRDPVKRYLSEWKHVQRGATWKTSRLICNGRPPTHDELKPCYNSSDWQGVTLDEFLNCRDNLAKNRQTRMLADLTKVNCYNTSSIEQDERDQIMLDSAKENLLKLAYFGLTEFQKYTQMLFEHTFKMKFKTPFSQLPVTHSDKTKISEEQKHRILEQNKLDIQLYQFAKDLFLQRIRQMKKDIKDYSPIVDYELENDVFDDSVDIEEETDEEEGYI